jgi:hypothetical protein
LVQTVWRVLPLLAAIQALGLELLRVALALSGLVMVLAAVVLLLAMQVQEAVLLERLALLLLRSFIDEGTNFAK